MEVPCRDCNPKVGRNFVDHVHEEPLLPKVLRRGIMPVPPWVKGPQLYNGLTVLWPTHLLINPTISERDVLAFAVRQEPTEQPLRLCLVPGLFQSFSEGVLAAGCEPHSMS